MNKSYFDVGDYVRVVSDREIYTSYKEWAKKFNLVNYLNQDNTKDYTLEYLTKNNSKYKVVVVGKHLTFGEILYGIENVYTGEQFIISEKGLKLVPKFEIGDLVVRTTHAHRRFSVGFTGKITGLSISRHELSFNNSSYRYDSSYFEHYKREIMTQTFNGVDANGIPKNFTDADLKPFMRVELANGRRGIIGVRDVKYDDRNTMVRSDGNWDHAMINHPGNSGFNIVKVYNPPLIPFVLNFDMEGNLVWQVKPQETEQEKAIRELEENIKASQEKLANLKKTLP